ncbi:hypothetical protein WA026_015473 [Henosepilachna vigintioctopunctata]|uniref:Uncharacterized protein n=1 Tax=Henosepilachna vigintioctopunctata TaxID=420089 RepID=A0AAW1UKL1_9CUCU
MMLRYGCARKEQRSSDGRSWGETLCYGQENDVIYSITRVPTTLKKKPRNIVVEFTTKNERNKLLKAAKAKRREHGSPASTMD